MDILNQSVLQNLKSMMGGQYGDFWQAISSMPGDFLIEQNIPSLSGQIARSIDQTKRSYYGSDEVGIESFVRRNAA